MSFNSWLPADTNNKLIRNDDGTYSISLTLDAGTTIQYKITRGSWNNEEVNSNLTSISNRSYVTTGGTENIGITVSRWKDL